tara:strand:- start:19809 stop:23966 length:4158 start_codon:yes stop_codon:yes gene_type:complete
MSFVSYLDSLTQPYSEIPTAEKAYIDPNNPRAEKNNQANKHWMHSLVSRPDGSIERWYPNGIWSDPEEITREGYPIEFFKEQLFATPVPSSLSTFESNVDGDNNYKAKPAQLNPSSLVDYPTVAGGQDLHDIADFHIRSVPQLMTDIGAEVPGHSFSLGGNLIDINGGGELTNLDHELFGLPSDFSRLVHGTSESLYFLDTYQDTLFPRTAWSVLEEMDDLPLSALSQKELRPIVDKLLRLSLPRTLGVGATLNGPVYEHFLWFTPEGNASVDHILNTSIIIPAKEPPGYMDKLGDAMGKLWRGFTSDIPNALFSLPSELSERLEKRTGAPNTIGDKAVDINKVVYNWAKTFEGFEEWWNSTTLGKIINKIASVPRKLDEGFERFDRRMAAKYGTDPAAVPRRAPLSDVPVATVTITPENIDFNWAEAIYSFLPEEEWQELYDIYYDVVTEGAYSAMGRGMRRGNELIKEGLSSVVEHGLIPSAFMAMGDMIIGSINDSDQEQVITEAFQSAVKKLSNTTSIFTGIHWPWLSPMSFDSPAVSAASAQLYGPEMSNTREADLSDALIAGPAMLDPDANYGQGQLNVNVFEENMRRSMNFSIKGQNFKTFQEAQSFIFGVIFNPDQYTLSEQHAYLTTWNTAFDAFKDQIDDGTSTSSLERHLGEMRRNLDSTRRGITDPADPKEGTDFVSIIWNLDRNTSTDKAYETEEGMRIWGEARSHAQDIYSKHFHALHPEGISLPEGADEWTLLPPMPSSSAIPFSLAPLDALQTHPQRHLASVLTLMELSGNSPRVNAQGEVVPDRMLGQLIGHMQSNLQNLDPQYIQDKVERGEEADLLPMFVAWTTMRYLTDPTEGPGSFDRRLHMLSQHGISRERADAFAITSKFLMNSHEPYNAFVMGLKKDPTTAIQNFASHLQSFSNAHRTIFSGLATILNGGEPINQITRFQIDALTSVSTLPDTPGLSDLQREGAWIDSMEAEENKKRIDVIDKLGKMGIVIHQPSDYSSPLLYDRATDLAQLKDRQEKCLADFQALWKAGYITPGMIQWIDENNIDLPKEKKGNPLEWEIGDFGHEESMWSTTSEDWEWLELGVIRGMTRLLREHPEARTAVEVLTTVIDGPIEPSLVLRGMNVTSIKGSGAVSLPGDDNRLRLIPDRNGLQDAFDRNPDSFVGQDTPFNHKDQFTTLQRQGHITTIGDPVSTKVSDADNAITKTIDLSKRGSLFGRLHAASKQDAGLFESNFRQALRSVIIDYSRFRRDNPTAFAKALKLDHGRLLVNAIHRLATSGDYPGFSEIGEFQFFLTPPIPQRHEAMYTPSAELEPYNLVDVVVFYYPQYVTPDSGKPASDAAVEIRLMREAGTSASPQEQGLAIGTVGLDWTKQRRAGNTAQY